MTVDPFAVCCAGWMWTDFHTANLHINSETTVVYVANWLVECVIDILFLYWQCRCMLPCRYGTNVSSSSASFAAIWKESAKVSFDTSNNNLSHICPPWCDSSDELVTYHLFCSGIPVSVAKSRSAVAYTVSPGSWFLLWNHFHFIIVLIEVRTLALKWPGLLCIHHWAYHQLHLHQPLY